MSQRKNEHYFSSKPSSEFKEFTIKGVLRNKYFEFYTAAGIFSPKKIDLGTSILIKNIDIPESGSVLDMGCGYGVVGIVIGFFNPKIHVDFVDINSRAIEMAQKNAEFSNLKNYKIYNEDYIKFFQKENPKFDAIYFNPPVKVGQKKYVSDIISALNHLNETGSFYLVIKKSLGAQGALNRIMDTLDEMGSADNYEVNVIAKNSGYWVSKITRKF